MYPKWYEYVNRFRKIKKNKEDKLLFGGGGRWIVLYQNTKTVFERDGDLDEHLSHLEEENQTKNYTV